MEEIDRADPAADVEGCFIGAAANRDGDGVVLFGAAASLGCVAVVLRELFGPVCDVALTGPDRAAFDPAFDRELGDTDDAGADVDGATCRAEPALGVVLARPCDPLGGLP